MNAPDDPQPQGAWSALAALSADLMALLDAQGRIVWVNAAFERASGHAAPAARGHTLAELLAVEGGSSPWPAVAEALAAGRAVDRVKLPWSHPSGDTRWGVLAAQPLAGEHAGVRVAVCLQDLSEQHHLAELLETAQEFGRLGIWERKIPSGQGRWD